MENVFEGAETNIFVLTTNFCKFTDNDTKERVVRIGVTGMFANNVQSNNIIYYMYTCKYVRVAV